MLQSNDHNNNKLNNLVDGSQNYQTAGGRVKEFGNETTNLYNHQPE